MTALAEVLDAAMRSLQARIHTGIPAEVVSFNPILNTIDAKLVIADFTFDGAGEREYDAADLVIPNVPVVWPRGGGYVMTLPLGAGDFVWLMFSERSLAEWRATGQSSEPNDTRRHSMGYPYALPGAFPDVEPLSPEPTKDVPNRTTKMVIGKDGHGAQIVIDGDDPVTPTIKLGRDATEWVALANKVDAIVDAIVNTVIVAGDGGAAIKTAVASAKTTNGGSVKATLTKAK